MIFYTIKGPSHLIEIHEDRMILKKRLWLKILTGPGIIKSWQLEELSHFSITIPQYLFWGKLEWKDFSGRPGTLRFSTNSIMMKKIESYLQKRILKNYQKVLGNSEELNSIKKEMPEYIQNMVA
jgi:hypothetical protein